MVCLYFFEVITPELQNILLGTFFPFRVKFSFPPRGWLIIIFLLFGLSLSLRMQRHLPAVDDYHFIKEMKMEYIIFLVTWRCVVKFLGQKLQMFQSIALTDAKVIPNSKKNPHNGTTVTNILRCVINSLPVRVQKRTVIWSRLTHRYCFDKVKATFACMSKTTLLYMLDFVAIFFISMFCCSLSAPSSVAGFYMDEALLASSVLPQTSTFLHISGFWSMVEDYVLKGSNAAQR